MGVAGILVGETHGGLGLGLLEAARSPLENDRRPCRPDAVPGRRGPCSAGDLGRRFRRSAVELAPQARGRQALAGIAIGEALGGARDGAGVEARDGRLTGKALFVIDHAEADMLAVADRAGGLHLAAGDAPGMTQIALETIDRTGGWASCVSRTPAEPLAGGEGVLDRLRDAAWIILAADMLKPAERCSRR